MTIENLTLGEIREIKSLLGKGCESESSPSFFKVGKTYLVRTVTFTTVGRLKAINANELLFQDASWIADTGRFHNALKGEMFDEIEPYVNDVIVNRGSIVDATECKHALPLSQK